MFNASRIGSALAAAFLLAGCFPTVPVGEGGCEKDGDCKDGTYCDLESKVCVKKEATGCTKNEDCPEGKTCDLEAKVCTAGVPKCSKDEDCATNEVCDQTLKICVDKGNQPCTKTCPTYFKCAISADTTQSCVRDESVPCGLACGDTEKFACVVNDDGTDYCALLAGVTVSAEVTAPTEGKKLKAGAIPVECSVSAPLVHSVRVELKHAAEAPSVTLSDAGNGKWSGSFDATTAGQGEWTAECVVNYGPAKLKDPDFRSVARKFVIDNQGPNIVATAPIAWQKRSGTVSITAVITDRGPDGLAAGVDANTVKLTGSGVTASGTATANANEYKFTIDLSQVEPADVQGIVNFVISADDVLGNAGQGDASLQVDAIAPVVTANSETNWRSRDEAEFTYTATVANASAGAPVKTVALVANGKTFAGTATATAGQYGFKILPADLSAAGQAGEASFTVSAEDEAGNIGSANGTFKIDGSKPVLEVVSNDPTIWYGPTNASASIVVKVTDTGAGPGLVRYQHAGISAPVDCNGSGETRTCVIPVSAIAINTENATYPIEITARDLVDNLSGVFSQTIQVDRKQPPGMVSADIKTNISGWRSWTATPFALEITLRDGGSGIDGGTGRLPKLVFGSGSSAVTYNGSRSGGTPNDATWTFQVKTSELIAANTTNAAVGGNLSFQDVAGNISTGSLSLKIDNQPPTISVASIPYKSGSALKRNDTATTITATVADPNSGSGVEVSTVKMSFTQKDGTTKTVTGTKASGDDFTWVFNASEPQFNAADGNVTLSFAASDAAGNVATPGTKAVALTRKLWEFDTGLAARVVGSVAFSAGRLYFVQSANDSVKDNVWAVNVADGTKAWSAKVAGTPTTPPSIGSDSLFFVFQDSSSKGNLSSFALQQSGGAVSAKWQCADIGLANGGLSIASLNWGGTTKETVFAATSKNQVYAMYQDVATCQKQGTGVVASSDPRDSSVSFRQNSIWWGLKTTRTANALFSSPDSGFLATNTTAIVGSGPVYGVALLNSGNAVSSPTGNVRIWNVGLNADYSASATQFQLPAVMPPSVDATGAVLFGSDDGLLFKFAPPATTSSSPYPLSMPLASPVKASPTLDSDGNAFVVTEDGILRTFTSNGSSRWTFDTGAGGVVSSNPVLSCSGALYLGTSNGRVIALQTDSAGLANSAWPRFQHDNRNTGNIDTPIYVNGTCQD